MSVCVRACLYVCWLFQISSFNITHPQPTPHAHPKGWGREEGVERRTRNRSTVATSAIGDFLIRQLIGDIR